MKRETPPHGIWSTAWFYPRLINKPQTFLGDPTPVGNERLTPTLQGVPNPFFCYMLSNKTFKVKGTVQ